MAPASHPEDPRPEDPRSEGPGREEPRSEDPRPGGPSARSTPAQPFPGGIPADDLDAYVGLPQREAEQRAYERGWRPVRSLPRDAVVTMEYVAGRLNFTLDGGRVARCWTG
ncbi:hypothetical protein [Streptomyces sp. NPDC021020]|uniref:hypothetical protein n=1 Tax=Streptomyces sp. NPDC021020 TaxID=3365109 RepID=UPI0037A83563